jgi:hypothetical protein
MKLRQVLISGWVALALMLICSTFAGAEVVGRLTQEEGRVELLKGGKLPAVALKLNDPVEPGDVIRTKSRSKAQVKFIDDSTLNLSQEARFAIEEFKFQPNQGKRRAVLKIFQGLALAVVNKILQAEEPDFVIKTQTAIVGVRGTEIGIRNEPNRTTILNFKGRTQVANILPQVSPLFLKASKVAYDWKPTGDAATTVLLADMQATKVDQGQPPTVPYNITSEEYQNFLRVVLSASGLIAEYEAAITPEDKDKVVHKVFSDADLQEYNQAITREDKAKVMLKLIMKCLGYADNYQTSTFILGSQGSKISTPGGPLGAQSTTPGSNIPISGGPPGPQNTINTLTTITVPPKVVPQVQTLPPPPPPPPPPAPSPSPPQYSPGY